MDTREFKLEIKKAAQSATKEREKYIKKMRRKRGETRPIITGYKMFRKWYSEDDNLVTMSYLRQHFKKLGIVGRDFELLLLELGKTDKTIRLGLLGVATEEWEGKDAVDDGYGNLYDWVWIDRRIRSPRLKEL